MSARDTIEAKNFPDAYKAFLPVLERLTEPMLYVLHGHILHLDDLFNSVQSHARNMKGDFEGLGGLTLRGDINRVVNSELLLRSEVPIEFLRRVAEGEALYMETEHSDPNQRVVYRVIISVGPYMLGHGRLLALASLIFLARAALAGKAELHWTFLPSDKSINWFEGLTVNSVKRFLKFASVRDATDEDISAAVERWGAFNETQNSSFSDVESWLIGANGSSTSFFETLTQGESSKNGLSLTLDPPPLEGARTATLDLRRNGRNVRRLRIDFPTDDICLSALNRPLNPKSPTPGNGPDSGQPIAKIGGWEPRYVLSYDARHHVIKFDHSRNGVLFLRLGKGQNTRSQQWFFSMPEDSKLVGIHFPSNLNAQIVTQMNDPNENISCFEYDLGKEILTLQERKLITSKHLFVKQRASVVPPMVSNYNRLKCYTTLGQAFEFDNIRDQKPTINILYKESLIVHSNAKYAISLFDPTKKTHQELQAIKTRVAVSHETPSLIVLKDHTKIIDAFPIENAELVKRLHNVVYTPSSHSLAYSIQPGEWIFLGENSARIALTLERYERVLRCHMSNDRTKIIVFSDASFGGENSLKSMTYIGEELSEQSKLYDFDKIRTVLDGEPIFELQEMINGGFRAISLNEDRDPNKLILLRKRGGQFKAEIIDLAQILENATSLQDEV